MLAPLITRMMHDGIAVQDDTGAIVYSNDKAATLLGMHPQDLLRRSSLDDRWGSMTLDGQPLPGECHPAMQAVITGSEVRSETMGVRGGDGRMRWLSVDSSPIDLPSGRYAVTVFTDITDALECHRQLHRTRAEIQQQLVHRDLPSNDRVRFVSGSRSSGPSTSIGGDFLGAHELCGERSDEVAFFIGDVCGHGILSAGLSGTARSTVRALSLVLDDPSDVVARLHDIVQEERPDSFLTTVYGRLAIDASGAALLRLCCAGHPHPLLVRDGAVQPVGVTAPLVGMVPNGHRPVSATALRRGDRVVMFTDGVLDDARPRRSHAELAAELPADGSLDEIVDWMMALASSRPTDTVDRTDDAAVLAFELR